MTELEQANGLKETYKNDAEVLRNHLEKISELAIELSSRATDKDQLKLADDILFWATVNKNAKERLA